MSGAALGASVVTTVAAYLIGSIPWAYVVVRAVQGVDIRTVGSGNVGATNAGRLLGFRFFLLVFLLDFLKGFLPTYCAPLIVRRWTGESVPGEAVYAAVAAILGHNFPIYLRFRGGKGVATSIGAVAALDPIAAGATVLAFCVFLLVTRFVGLSSAMGGIVFVAAHFARSPRPWARDQAVLSGALIGLLVLLIARHRSNFVRMAAGTEPKISFSRRGRPPAGRIRLPLLAGLALIAVLAAVAVRADRPTRFETSGFRLDPIERASTGHQRADRVTFLDKGRLLAVACPRYGRAVLYKVSDDGRLALHRDIRLAGRPVAIASSADRVYVLQRPNGDARHLEEGFWQTFDFDGRAVGSLVRVGWDPDDLAVAPDGSLAYVLLSGRAEGESNRPAPSLTVFRLGAGDSAVLIGSCTFTNPADDPDRLFLSSSGTHAAVGLHGSNEIAAVALADPASPALLARLKPSRDGLPYEPPTSADGEAIRMPGRPGLAAVVLQTVIASADTEAGELRFHDLRTRSDLGRLALHGTANLIPAQPTDLAASSERKLLAVATKSGGILLFRWTATDPARTH